MRISFGCPKKKPPGGKPLYKLGDIPPDLKKPADCKP
jgi:hypothetical protein